MNHAKILLIFSAIFGIIGVGLGAHMSGAGSYAFRPIHAHVSLVGWLTLFAWSMYYKVYQPKRKTLSNWQTITGVVGAIGLTMGMWFYNMNPFGLPDGVTLAFYIAGGMALVVAFLLFLLLVILEDGKKSKA
ncbi:hypothetical protein [Alkalihalobacillus pseudalcaliphilus]|uniref:hypothetical protein n=1 Tax=Alkalihalobacillus pseudalcaliphilus TaxID=79884 RepID=UPI00064DE53B|nr:hypothetical protein [Alkalihalobacillus pseudalcaliphilus]KMK78102.1 hypothetical protein AB990_01230 [Alkalihalobacillus pseudalcaliphilus]